jgi:hypothetical protein
VCVSKRGKKIIENDLCVCVVVNNNNNNKKKMKRNHEFSFIL